MEKQDKVALIVLAFTSILATSLAILSTTVNADDVYFLKQGGGNVTELNDLSDVSITNPQESDILFYFNSSAQWENIPLDSSVNGFLYLNNITDVCLISPVDSDVLTFQGPPDNCWRDEFFDTGILSKPLESGHMLFGSGGDTSIERIPNGDLTLSALNATHAIFTINCNSIDTAICYDQFNDMNGNTLEVLSTNTRIATFIGNASGASRFVIEGYGSTVNFDLMNARGTFENPTATQNNDLYSRTRYQGYDGTSFGVGGAVNTRACATWTTTNHCSNMVVSIVPSGSTTVTGHTTFNNDGTLNTGPINFASKSSDPTTADIPAGYCQTFKNTTSGLIRYWCNDAGTLKSVTLV